MRYEVWVAGQLNGTKLAMEVFETIAEASEFAAKLLARSEIKEVGIRDWGA